MKIGIYTVYDKKTKSYGSPFGVRFEEEALRSWENVKKDRNTKYGTNPEDYDLYETAIFDDDTGEIEAHKPTFKA